MQGILFDLDGVVYMEEEAIRGAVQTLSWVQRHGIPYLFVSNTSGQPRRMIVEKLARMSIDVAAEDILIPPVAAARRLKQEAREPVALLLPEQTWEDFDGLEILDAAQEEGAGAVVIGHLGRIWDYGLLNRAFRLLMETPQAELIALGTTRYAREGNGLVLGVGPFVAALEYATGRKARVLGKPAADFFEAAREILGTEAGQTVMIGDDIDGDVGAAQKCGMKGIQVRTGKFREADLEGGVVPDAVLDSIADLPRWWQSKTGSSPA